MDNKINATIEKINLKNSHPNLSYLWKRNIIEKKNNLLKTLQDCDNLFDNLNDKPDLDFNTILTMIFIKQNMINDLNE